MGVVGVVMWLEVTDALWPLSLSVPPTPIFCEQMGIVFGTKFAVPIRDLDGRTWQTFLDIDLPPVEAHETTTVSFALPRLSAKSSMERGRINCSPFGLP